MNVFGVDFSAGAVWLAAALLLVIAEMLVPGFFLIFMGAGAAVTGLVALLVPGLPVIVQALVFAGVSGAAMLLGRRWYHRSDKRSADPLLNDRTARLIGQRVEVCEAIVAGAGRVRVGDGTWNATGPDVPAGATVRIVSAAGSLLRVEVA